MNPFASIGKYLVKQKEDKALAFLCSDKIGQKVSKDDIEIIDKNHYASIDPNKSFYYYDGPLDDKTRAFCATLLLQGKFYSQKKSTICQAVWGTTWTCIWVHTIAAINGSVQE